MNNQNNNLSSKHRRDKLEIISSIINIAQHPTTVSKLTSYTCLSYASIKQHLTYMIKAGLISNHTVIRGKKKRNYPAYCATEKGNRFLELYCTNLLLLCENNTLEDNLGDKYLLQYFMNNRTTLISKFTNFTNNS